jgi:hypothetical protein
MSGRAEYQVNKQTITTPADEEFTAHMEIRQQNEGWSWLAKFDTHWDADADTYTNDISRGYTDRLPEINLTFQPTAFPARYRNLFGFQMQQLNLVGGLYYIGPVQTERNGFYGSMDTRFSRTNNINASHTLQSDVDYWQAISSTGDARFTYSTQVTWNWNIATKIKWQLGWARTDTSGRIPLTGLDRPGSPNNRLNWSLNYQNGRLYTIRLSTSYVLRRAFGSARNNLWTMDRMQPLQLSVNYTPGRSASATLSTSYDLVRKDFTDFRITYNMTDDRSYRLQSSMTIATPGRIKNMTASLDFVLGEDWDGRINTDLSPHSGGVIRDVSLTHRLNCTYLAFQYRTQDDFWGFTWGITGYPQGRLGYTSNEDMSSFGPDLFNTFQSSGSGFGAGGF